VPRFCSFSARTRLPFQPAAFNLMFSVYGTVFRLFSMQKWKWLSESHKNHDAPTFIISSVSVCPPLSVSHTHIRTYRTLYSLHKLLDINRSRKQRLTAVGIRCADPLKLALTSLTSVSRSVGIVRLRTTGHGIEVAYLWRTFGDILDRVQILQDFDWEKGPSRHVKGGILRVPASFPSV
jgi:hypothetical protein